MVIFRLAYIGGNPCMHVYVYSLNRHIENVCRCEATSHTSCAFQKRKNIGKRAWEIKVCIHICTNGTNQLLVISEASRLT